MDVLVQSKREQRQRRSTLVASVLGDGLLERARSTSLVLLGLTAAVGLAMVALALNQGWPLIAGAPIPGFGDRHQAVGDATIAAEARASAHVQAPHGTTGSGAVGRSRRGDAGRTPAPAGSQPPRSADLVVSQSLPTGSPGDDPSGGGAAPGPAPAEQPTTAPVPAPAPAPEQAPASSPVASPPSPVPQTQPDPPASSPAAVASEDGASHDHSHHFGKGPRWGHGRPRGGDDAAEPAPEETAEPAPSPPVAPPAEPESDEVPESEPPLPSWSHGGRSHGHGHGHGRW